MSNINYFQVPTVSNSFNSFLIHDKGNAKAEADGLGAQQDARGRANQQLHHRLE